METTIYKKIENKTIKNESQKKNEIIFGVPFEKNGREYYLEITTDDLKFFLDLGTLWIKKIIAWKLHERLNEEKTAELFQHRRAFTAERYFKRSIERERARGEFTEKNPLSALEIDPRLKSFAQYL
jgi:hypothetical protein